MTLREKLMHYTHDLDCGVDLKKEAIATIEHIAQYMGEDELLHHSRPLALAYLALTEDASAPVVHGRWEYIPQTLDTLSQFRCSVCGWWSLDPSIDNAYDYCPNCGAKMDGGVGDAKSV